MSFALERHQHYDVSNHNVNSIGKPRHPDRSSTGGWQLLKSLASLVLTLGIGAAGGGLATFVGLPGGWVIGALTAAALAGFLGLNIAIPRLLRSISMGFAGLVVGAAINDETLRSAATLPWSLLGMVAALLAVVLVSYALHRHWHASGPTAIAASWPGHLLLAMAGAESLKADMERVAVVQSVRLLALVVVLPLAVGAFHRPAGEVAAGLPLDLGLGVALAAVCTWLSIRLKIVGGEMFLTALMVGLLASAGLLRISVPAPANAFFQVVVGAYVGIGVARCRAQDLRRAFRPSLAAAVVAAVLTLAFAVPLAWLLDQPVAMLALAYAPGGAEAMILLSGAFHVDAGVVGIHHTLRLLGLTLIFPAVLRFFRRGAYQPTGNR